MGPSWYWPHMQPAIAELVEELGLAAFCQNSDGDVIFERMSREAAQRYRGVVQDQQSMRLVGGTSSLVRALARDLPAERIRLKARVTAMALLPKGVELTIGDAESLTVGHVIAALPPRLLEATTRFIHEGGSRERERKREGGGKAK
ncbi:flavin-dependent amine oxidoreductase [Novosphingobium sp. PhB57]|uniref:FAD-dependent oxidoreductase n=1 Tax=Novosphingobium sp. PhB57 TaxID=2485107 RepID=UPI0010E9602E|nr:FAD-dependent oxidoreductase [Novosphingobium sp. PhB57]TCU58474.1 flavin-dependent amine oxidoreductase [Novosphingobium sp. PhB57]